MPKRIAFLLVLLFASAAWGADEVQPALKQLKRARTPEQKIQAVKKLGATGHARAATALARLAEIDDDLEVRVRALRALGHTLAESACDLLLARIRQGGPLAVRDAAAWALARKPKGARLLIRALESRGITTLEKGLLYRAMGAFRDEKTRDALEQGLQATHPYLAAEALRAYLARPDTRAARAGLLTKLLTEGRDAETLLPALEVAEVEPTEALRPALERLRTFLEPEIQAPADHILRKLDALAAARSREPAPGKESERYGKAASPPPIVPPTDVPTRSRHDVVYVVDVTGSTVATLPQIRQRIGVQLRAFADQGLNLRVGVVAYRGGHGVRQRMRGLEVLPPTYDMSVVREFLDGLEPGGVDDRGGTVGAALRIALDQIGWRRGARRGVRLIADGDCARGEQVVRRVRIHYEGERTRTRVSYVLRTRSSHPHVYDEIAEAGGTGVVELLE